MSLPPRPGDLNGEREQDRKGKSGLSLVSIERVDVGVSWLELFQCKRGSEDSTTCTVVERKELVSRKVTEEYEKSEACAASSCYGLSSKSACELQNSLGGLGRPGEDDPRRTGTVTVRNGEAKTRSLFPGLSASGL